MPATRRCKGSWLKTLMKCVEDTESPRHFWLWAGISIIAGALERKVWLPYGMFELYPNMYVMIVAPPGRCRKGSPLTFAKDILKKIDVNIFSDSPTRRAMTKELSLITGQRTFYYMLEGQKKMKTHASLMLISKELSSFLAIDPKGMIELLTDLFDAHDEWEYKTSEKGTDTIKNLCINCLFATTPSWIADNLPQEAIGGGFTSRFAIISGRDKYKFVACPPPLDDDLYADLVHDLNLVSGLAGQFEWGEGAMEFFEEWYATVEGKVQAMRDERLHGYIERMHIMVLKVAMCLHVAEGDSLVLERDDIYRATLMLEDVLKGTGAALSGQGGSKYSAKQDKALNQIRVVRTLTFKELMLLMYRDVTKPELMEIVETLEASGLIELSWSPDRTELMINATGEYKA